MSGRTTTKRKGQRTIEYRTHAAADQATAVQYLEACRDSEHGEYGAWLIGELLPKGVHMYPANDQVACAQKVRGHLRIYSMTGSGIGPFAKRLSNAEADRLNVQLFGPYTPEEQHRRNA